MRPTESENPQMSYLIDPSQPRSAGPAKDRVATRARLTQMLATDGGVDDEADMDAKFLWLDDAACADQSIDAYFVPAGHSIDDATLKMCLACPVRTDCLRHAYAGGYTNGYFGAVSPGQRRTMTLDEALAFDPST